MPSHFSPDELRTENDILKMKMMLEYGAQFYTPAGAPELDPELEHQFLKHVEDFEKNWKNAREITIWEKIGCPENIPMLHQLYEAQIPEAIENLQELLMENGIYFTVLSPNVTPSELYRFMTEELPQKTMYDYSSPGMFCLVYDEFYPDPHYENEQMALNECMQRIIGDRDDFQFIPVDRFISLNEEPETGREIFFDQISRFRRKFRSINNIQLDAKKTYLAGNQCTVKGHHETGLCTDNHCFIARGSWQVDLNQNDSGEWLIHSIRIEGIHF